MTGIPESHIQSKAERGRSALVVVGIFIALFAAALCVSVAYSIAMRDMRDTASVRAAQVRRDVEALEAMHLRANAQFLSALGTSRAGYYAWPIERVGEAVQRYTDLDSALADDPVQRARVEALRQATARWVWQLSDVTVHSSREGPRMHVDGALLYAANTTLSTITNALGQLREEQNRVLRVSAETAKQHLRIAQFVLAVAVSLAGAFLFFGIVARRHAALARGHVDFVRQENDRRFHDYFDHHPLAMLIFELGTGKILAANGAATDCYGYRRDAFLGMTMDALYAAHDRFDDDMRLFCAAPLGSGLTGIRGHIRSDGSEISARLSYHLLRYAHKDACYVTVIDVTELEQARSAVQESKRMLETVLNGVPNRIFWTDRNSRYLGCNRPFARDAGLAEPEAVVGLTDRQMPWAESEAMLRRLDTEIIATGHALLQIESPLRLADGQMHWLRGTKVPLRDVHGAVVGVLTAYEDISGYKDAELALRLRSRALDAIVNAVLITRPAEGGNLIEYANPAFERITGYRREQVLGRDCKFLQRGDRQQQGIAHIRQALTDAQEVTTLLRNYRSDGSLFWNQLYIAPVRDESGAVTHHISVVNDVTELVQSRDLLFKQSRFDRLTNLPNRVLIGETIENAIAARAPFALLFMDVDHFKDVNDALGHSSGDRLLREVAERLAAQTGPDDAVGRYGGDEFVMIIAEPTKHERLKRALDGIKAAFAAPVQIDDVQIHVRTSIGITLYPADGDDAETLLKNADAAMYAAKAAGRDGVRRFEPALRRAAEWRMALSRSLRTAAQDGELTLLYQPQVDIHTGRVSGLEALLRWNDPEHGAVSPAEFIPVAEETGLIAEIGEWVLHKACVDAKQWGDAYPDLRVSVNVSPQQITRGDFCAVLERVLDATQLVPSRLELEITESVLVAPGAFPTLRALSELGVGIAIDDFGSGYSSLSYLRDFHADRLKIDMSFVRGIGVNSADEAVIKAILALARTLGFTVVAEGVETVAQLEFLLEGQCDVVQGYYFARPMPAAEVSGFIASFEPAFISNA